MGCLTCAFGCNAAEKTQAMDGAEDLNPTPDASGSGVVATVPTTPSAVMPSASQTGITPGSATSGSGMSGNAPSGSNGVPVGESPDGEPGDGAGVTDEVPSDDGAGGAAAGEQEQPDPGDDGAAAGDDGMPDNDAGAMAPTDPQPEDPATTPAPPSGTPTQEQRAALPAVRQEHSAAALEGEVYVIGGFTPSVTASVQAYDPLGDSWRARADFPTALHHANVAAASGKIYVLGFNRGSSFTDIDGRVFAYDPSNDVWEERAPLPVGTERSSSCVATLGSKIYLFGGSTNTAGTSVSVSYSSAYDTELDEWQELPDLPETREHCLAGGVDDLLYIVSGRSGGIGGISPQSWAFDPATNMYSERQPIPTPRGGTAGAVLGGRIYVFGGEGNGDDPDGIFHEVEVYDPSTDSWEQLPDMLIARHGFAAAALEQRIYLPGGATSQGFGAGEAHTVFFFE